MANGKSPLLVFVMHPRGNTLTAFFRYGMPGTVRIATPAAVMGTVACLLLGMVFLWYAHDAPRTTDPPPNHPPHALNGAPRGSLQELSKNANRRSQQSLRQWAKQLDDESLVKVAKDLIASLTEITGAGNADTKCLAWAVFQEWGRRNVDEATYALQDAG